MSNLDELVTNWVQVRHNGYLFAVIVVGVFLLAKRLLRPKHRG